MPQASAPSSPDEFCGRLSLTAISHRLLESEVESESGALQQRLEVAEETLGQRERELTEARERISSLSDELVISQGKVRGGQQVNYIVDIHKT